MSTRPRESPPLTTRAPAPSGRRRPSGGCWPHVAALVATIWVSRGLLGGDLPGNTGDARWTIAVHEHWYRVWSGLEGFRDLVYYAPLDRTLGTSDTFVVPGQLYALLRALGADPVTAWASAGTCYFLVGALGVAVLSTRLLATVVGRTAFVFLGCTSYPLLAMIGHPQLIGLLSASWIVVGVLDVWTGRSVVRGFTIVLLVTPVLALSSWYAVGLLALVLGPMALMFALVTPRRVLADGAGKVMVAVRAFLRRPAGLTVLVLGILGWAVVLWVYLPTRSLMPATTFEASVLFFPQWTDVVNASNDGGGLWAGVYEDVFGTGPVAEVSYGFTPVFAALLLGCGLAAVRRVTVGRPASDGPVPFRRTGVAGSHGVLALCLTIVVVLAILFVDDRGNGIYRVLWNTLPGLDSLRTPFRVMAYLVAVALVVIIRTAEMQWSRPHRPMMRQRLGVAIVLLAGLVAVEGYRGAGSHWRGEDLLRPDLAAQIEPAQVAGCRAVVVLADDEALWKQLIDAVIFATLSGIPTPQGYSRGEPYGYPLDAGDGSVFVPWMHDRGFNGRVCRVTPNGVTVLAG